MKSGTYIHVKKKEFSRSAFQIKAFLRFEADKILCLSRSGNLLYFDYYQECDDLNFPDSRKWKNSEGSLIEIK